MWRTSKGFCRKLHFCQVYRSGYPAPFLEEDEKRTRHSGRLAYSGNIFYLHAQAFIYRIASQIGRFTSLIYRKNRCTGWGLPITIGVTTTSRYAHSSADAKMAAVKSLDFTGVR